MKSYVFSAKTKEITLKLIQIKAKFTFFNRHGLRFFFFALWFLGFSKALTNWVKTQNYQLENMRLIRKTLKKKKKPTKKNKQTIISTHYICGVQKWSKKKGKQRSKREKR